MVNTRRGLVWVAVLTLSALLTSILADEVHLVAGVLAGVLGGSMAAAMLPWALQPSAPRTKVARKAKAVRKTSRKSSEKTPEENLAGDETTIVPAVKPQGRIRMTGANTDAAAGKNPNGLPVVNTKD